MNLREADVLGRLKRFLDRRTMPTALQGKPDAIRDELEAMCRVILKFAGREMADWWPKFEAEVGTLNTTRSWPTEGEVAKACRSVSEVRSVTLAEPGDTDPVAFAAKRIKAGETVGDHWLYGPQCLALLKSGLVTDADLAPYRSSLFFAMSNVWGEDKARADEAARRQHHDEARRMA
jgi:hypothetical protein